MIRPFQLDLVDEPFWLLVGCIMTNRTRWADARPYFERLYCDATPGRLARIGRGVKTGQPEAIRDLDAIREALRPLGLARARAHSIVMLALYWCDLAAARRLPATWRDVKSLPGCGSYAAEAWRIFIDGDLGFQPVDKVFSLYVRQRRRAEGSLTA